MTIRRHTHLHTVSQWFLNPITMNLSTGRLLHFSICAIRIFLVNLQCLVNMR